MASPKPSKLHRVANGVASSDWSLLPDVLLLDVLRRLRTLEDFFAVRGVCRSWRSASAPSPSSLASQSPLLLITRYPSYSEAFYDVAARRLYNLSLPWSPPSRFTLAFAHGHLVTIAPGAAGDLANSKILLWDLFTESKIRLPRNPEPFKRIMLSGRPDSTDCVVVLFEGVSDLVQYLKVGDSLWTLGSSPELRWAVDMMFFKGELLALTGELEVLAVELTGDSLTVRKLGGGGGGVVEPRNYHALYLGESDGELLAVCKNFLLEFDVLRWNSLDKGWEEFPDLGDKALFIRESGYVVSVSAPAMGLRKNCVYLSGALVGMWMEFSLEDRSFKEVMIDYPGVFIGGFIMSAVWVFPNIC